MYSIQQQYNVVPGQYNKEMAEVSIFPHIKSVARDVVEAIQKAVTIARGRKSRCM